MDGVIAFASQWLLLVPAILVVAAIARRSQWAPDLIEAALAGIATIAFVKIAGMAVFENRPFIVEHLRPIVPHGADNSFPSDHLAACGLAVVYLWPRSKPLAIISLFAAALIAVARVVARLHWPFDVVGGFVLGSVATAIVHSMVLRTKRRVVARG